MNNERELPETITCPHCEADMILSDNGFDWVCTKNAEPTTDAEWEALEDTDEDFCENVDVDQWVADMDEDNRAERAEWRS